MNWNDLREKLYRCARYAPRKFATDQLDRLVECCRNLEASEDANEIVGLMCA